MDVVTTRNLRSLSALQRFRTSLLMGMVVLVPLVMVLNLVAAWRAPVWSPRNELAHYDFIDQIGRLRLPRPGDPISDYTYRITTGGFTWKKPSGFDGSRESMGIEGLSYEVHQPPLYYTLMAIPNIWLKSRGEVPAVQIRLLRCVQVLVAGLGFLLLIPIFRELSVLGGFSTAYGVIAAVGMMLCNVGTYTTLGNDSFSALFCNLAVLFHLRYWRRGAIAELAGASFAVAGALLVKHTNGLMLPLHLVSAASFALSRHDGAARKPLLIGAIPVFLLAISLVFNRLYFGRFLPLDVTEQYFENVVTPTRGAWRLVRTLVLDSLTLRHLHFQWPPWAARYLLAMLALNTLLSGYRVLWLRARGGEVIVLICCLMSLSVIGSALFLNTYKPGVWWSAFRHFYGYQVFWWIALFRVPIPLPARTAARTAGVIGAGVALLVVWYVYLSMQ